MSNEAEANQVNPPALSSKLDKKRKRHTEDSSSKPEANGNTDNGNNITNDDASAQPSKRKLKKAKKNKKHGLQEEQDVKDQEHKDEEHEDGIDESIGKMDSRLLADYIAQRTMRLNKALTAVELEDLNIPESAILDTSSFKSRRSLEQLPTFLRDFSPKGSDLSKSSEEKGSPHTLVLSPAALRAAELVRALRTFQNKDSTVAKLFAKHIKIEDAKQFLRRARTGIGVGTPARISDLVTSGTLKLNELERVVIDGSYIDKKKRGIFDMKETHFPLLQLLTRKEFRERYESRVKPARILVY